MTPVTVILIQALLAGLGTCLGAVIVLCCGQLKRNILSLILAMAAGIMTAVILLDLIPSALTLGGIWECPVGFVSGLGIIKILDRLVSRQEYGSVKGNPSFLNMGYLIAIGIALHDLPEGLAIAAGFSAPGTVGPVIALAIGLHNIPEGMVTAAPLKAGGAPSRIILILNGAVSIVTPLGTLLGLLILDARAAPISLLLAFAAGAMTYIVGDKLIPTAREYGRNIFCRGIIPGFAVMSIIKLSLE